MVSEVRTTGVININGQIGTNTSILNGVINSRKRIRPADIDLIKQTYNLFIQHTHQMYDESYRAYENTPPRESSDRTTTSAAVYTAPNLGYTIVFDSDAQGSMADNIFDLVNKFNSYIYTHYHEWQDESF